MSAHTPGPWQYFDGVVDAPVGFTRPATLICERISAREMPHGSVDERQAQADANGRLIAAAPDLAEALQPARECLELYCDHPDAELIVGRARAALAKAGL